ncbi:MAG TPA: DUF4097 domain-containing protein [Clostridiales bacterium]|nr:DUF4097 domain-containing protein [Clostridiales bacterium]
MTTFQKMIQYIAMGFAGLLALFILFVTLGVVFPFLSITGSFDDNTSNYSKEFENITSLDIDVGAANFYIKTGDKFKVEAKNISSNFKVSVSQNNNLRISNTNIKNNLFSSTKINKHAKITVFLPENFIADNITLDAGAGNVHIDLLNTHKLTFNAGAGNIIANNINAKHLILNGGVGNVSFTNSVFNSSYIVAGVGNLSFEGVLYGINKISCGVGNLTLNINSKFEDYDMSVSSGIGKIMINGQSHTNFNSDNGKSNLLTINGGIGNVFINFE